MYTWNWKESKAQWYKLPDVFPHGIIFDSSAPKWPLLKSTIRTTVAAVPRRVTPSNVPTTAPATLSGEVALRAAPPVVEIWMQLKLLLYKIHYCVWPLEHFASPCILMSVIRVGDPDGMVVRDGLGSVLTPKLPSVMSVELPWVTVPDKVVIISHRLPVYPS